MPFASRQISATGFPARTVTPPPDSVTPACTAAHATTQSRASWPPARALSSASTWTTRSGRPSCSAR